MLFAALDNKNSAEFGYLLLSLSTLQISSSFFLGFWFGFVLLSVLWYTVILELLAPIYLKILRSTLKVLLLALLMINTCCIDWSYYFATDVVCYCDKSNRQGGYY